MRSIPIGYRYRWAALPLDRLMITINNVGGLWTLEWAWHSAETNLRCAGISGICMPNPSIVVSEISAFIRTDGQTDMARSTRR